MHRKCILQKKSIDQLVTIILDQDAVIDYQDSIIKDLRRDLKSQGDLEVEVNRLNDQIKDLESRLAKMSRVYDPIRDLISEMIDESINDHYESSHVNHSLED